MTGVLAVQGDFIEHIKMLERLGDKTFEIRKRSDLDRDFDRLVLPGGESTVQTRLVRDLGLFDILKAKINSGMPTLATCAGLILLAKETENSDSVCFGTLPVTVKRNAYGRQLGSFRTFGDFYGIGKVPMEFIRAPYITRAGDGVSVMSVTGGNITAVKYKNQLAMAFHPELLDDTRIFESFLNM